MIKSRRMRWIGHVERSRESYIFLFRTICRKTTLGRPKCRCEDNNKIDLQERGWGGSDCINMALVRIYWRAFVNIMMIPNSIKEFGISWSADQQVAVLLELVTSQSGIKMAPQTTYTTWSPPKYGNESSFPSSAENRNARSLTSVPS
jgi:hypothetical protein